MNALPIFWMFANVFLAVGFVNRFCVVLGLAEAAIESPVVEAFRELPFFLTADVLPDFIFRGFKQAIGMFAFGL